MDNNETFTYSYSADQQEEINAIRQKYMPKKDDKMEQLRRLDNSVAKKGTMISIAAGVVGVLLLGVGMCCTMVWADKFFVIGIIIGLIGIAVIAAAYPVYNKITKREKEKIAPLIIRLTDELIKERN
ncbi:MAG: hypothetical protein NC397_04685 [Clostridium sp.]|nr:hypothetical protein [Clostridium sp.]